jgi:hypothetical protein
VSIDNNTNHYVYVLMYNIRIDFLPTMSVNIRNRCSDFKLINLIRSAPHMTRYPNAEVDAGSMTSATLTPSCAVFEGSLMYQLQRKDVRSDDQLESTYTLLFIAWESEGCRELRACVRMIECDEQIKWNSYKLKEYCQRYASRLSAYTGPIEDTWLIHDGTVLTTRLELDFPQRDGRLYITISEGSRDNRTKISAWISPKT